MKNLFGLLAGVSIAVTASASFAAVPAVILAAIGYRIAS